MTTETPTPAEIQPENSPENTPQTAQNTVQEDKQEQHGQDRQDVFDRAYVEKLREENARARRRAKDVEASASQWEDMKQQMGRMLGFVDDGDPTEQLKSLAQERDEQTRALAQARMENTVVRAAVRLNADPDLLLDSKTFERAMNSLDPTADDYTAQVEELIVKVAGSRAVPQAGTTASGTEQHSGEGATLSGIDAYRKAHVARREARTV